MNYSYTKILIKFEKAIVSQQTTYSQDFSKYYIKITSPTEPLPYPYATQTLGEDTIVPIPSDGLIKLQLLPSLHYKCKGEYIVKYYKKGNFINHFRQERWVVPASLSPQIASSQVQASNNTVKLAYPVFEIIKVEPELPYLVQLDSLVWTQNSPVVGSMINITYQPAVTLDTLIRLGDLNNNGKALFNNGLTYNYY